LCPKNADPLDDGKVYETQQLVITTAAARDGTTGYFTLTYVDNYGESWTTSTIGPMDLAGTSAATLIDAALEGIPNGIVQDTSVACTSTSNTVLTCTVQFTNNAGALNDLTATIGAGTNSVAVTTTVPGTTVLKECSGRGICDYDTGICKCFRGYRTDDCHLQHALAF